MKDYTNYTVLDFSADEYFRSWVLKPNAENVTFWENWITNHPALKDRVLEAAEMIVAVRSLYPDNLTEESRREALDNLFAQKQTQKEEPINSRIAWGGNWYKVAAIWLAIAGLAATYYLTKYQDNPVKSKMEIARDSALPKMVIKANNSSQPLTVLLGDGSVIALEKGGVLTYPEKFTDSLRKVSLTGEAFFDIARDTSKPFVVYSESTVTRVLGTSFRIKSSKEGVLVAVKTGKVSVRSVKQRVAGQSEKQNEVLLTPNQQVMYSLHNQNFEESIVHNPQKIASDSDNKELTFDEVPVSDIFHALEKNYGIRIAFEETRFSTCRLTTQFTDETLRQRLEAICQVTGADFKITDGQVIIGGTCEQ